MKLLAFTLILSCVFLVECELEEKLEFCAKTKFDLPEDRKNQIMYFEGDLNTTEEKCFLACFLIGFEMMEIDGTLKMDRIKQFVELVEQYSERESKSVDIVGLKHVYEECAQELTANEDICEAGYDLRNCILEKREKYGVRNVGESIWL